MLPDLVLLKVFGFFGITQRFRLRLVCKHWRFLVDQVRQSNLCLYEFCFPKENQLSANQEIEVRPDEIVWIDTEPGANFSLETTFFRKLERLFLYGLVTPANLLYQINFLDCLKELGICLPVCCRILQLELKNLEVLSIRETRFDYLELNTPNLNTLVLWQGSGRRQVKVLFPEKVTFLECDDFPIDLKQFVNLETLLTRKQAVNLDDHPKLKVLDLRDQEKGLWENLRAQALGRKNLTIYSFGFRNIFCARSTDKPVRICEEFLSEHYALLECPIPFKMNLHYKKLVSAFSGSIPKSLSRKLINITRIGVSPRQQVNHLHLISLLKESKCETLTVHTEFPQTFFDSLPDCFLDSLSIDHYLYRPHDLNLDFLAKLTKLRFAYLNLNVQKLPFDSICETIQKCRFLTRFNLTNEHITGELNFKIEISFDWRFKPKITDKFEINGEKLQKTTKEETIRKIRELACSR